MKTRSLFLVFGLFLILAPARIFTLDAHWTSDETTWLYRSAVFMGLVQSGEFQETRITHHPGVTTMWLAGLRRAFGYQEIWLSERDLATARWFICVVIIAGMVVTFFLLRRLFDWRCAATAWAFFAANPFFLAQTRKVHTDALATLFIVLTVLLFLRYALESDPKRNKLRHGYLILSGTAFGLACLSKSYSLILLPWVPICLWLCCPTKIPPREFIYNAFITGVCFINWSLLAIFLVWPIFWQPLGLCLMAGLLGSTLFLQYAVRVGQHTVVSLWLTTFILMIGASYGLTLLWIVFDKVGWALTTAHEIDHFFLGKIIADPGVLFYLFTLTMKSTPFVLPLAIGAIPFLFKHRQDIQISKDFKVAIALFAVVVLFTVCLSVTSKKFSRYLLPAFPMLDILAGIGIFYAMKWIGERVKKGHIRKVVHVGCVAFVLLFTVVPVFALHPYYGTYYNLCWKVTDIRKIITVGDASGLDLAAKYLNRKPNAIQMSVQASHLGSEFLRYYFIGSVFQSDKNRNANTNELRHADYEVVYIRDLQIGRVPKEGTRGGRLEHTITLNGIDLVWIYHIPKKNLSNDAQPLEHSSSLQQRR